MTEHGGYREYSDQILQMSAYTMFHHLSVVATTNYTTIDNCIPESENNSPIWFAGERATAFAPMEYFVQSLFWLDVVRSPDKSLSCFDSFGRF